MSATRKRTPSPVRTKRTKRTARRDPHLHPHLQLAGFNDTQSTLYNNSPPSPLLFLHDDLWRLVLEYLSTANILLLKLVAPRFYNIIASASRIIPLPPVAPTVPVWVLQPHSTATHVPTPEGTPVLNSHVPEGSPVGTPVALVPTVGSIMEFFEPDDDDNYQDPYVYHRRRP